MKALSLSLALLLSSLASAKIYHKDQRFFIETKGKSVALDTLNSMIEKKQISTVKLYRGGMVHMLSFAKTGEKEKHYSVDEKGYIYSIEPFSSYSVEDVDAMGEIRFKEKPMKKYFITNSGFYIHK